MEAVQVDPPEDPRLRRAVRRIREADRLGVGGKLTGLLRLLAEHEGAVEADLQRFYGTDYRDRWHPDRRRRLTLRRLNLLVRYLPGDAAMVRAANGGRPVIDQVMHVLQADTWQAITGSKRPHPLIADARRSTKKHRKTTPERHRKLADARRRARERRTAGDGGD